MIDIIDGAHLLPPLEVRKEPSVFKKWQSVGYYLAPSIESTARALRSAINHDPVSARREPHVFYFDRDMSFLFDTYPDAMGSDRLRHTLLPATRTTLTSRQFEDVGAHLLSRMKGADNSSVVKEYTDILDKVYKLHPWESPEKLYSQYQIINQLIKSIEGENGTISPEDAADALVGNLKTKRDGQSAYIVLFDVGRRGGPIDYTEYILRQLYGDSIAVRASMLTSFNPRIPALALDEHDAYGLEGLPKAYDLVLEQQNDPEAVRTYQEMKAKLQEFYLQNYLESDVVEQFAKHQIPLGMVQKRKLYGEILGVQLRNNFLTGLRSGLLDMKRDKYGSAVLLPQSAPAIPKEYCEPFNSDDESRDGGVLTFERFQVDQHARLGDFKTVYDYYKRMEKEK